MFDWSGKNRDKSGKSQGILISCVSGNPGLRPSQVIPKTIIKMVQTASLLSTQVLG